MSGPVTATTLAVSGESTRDTRPIKPRDTFRIVIRRMPFDGSVNAS